MFVSFLVSYRRFAGAAMQTTALDTVFKQISPKVWFQPLFHSLDSSDWMTILLEYSGAHCDVLVHNASSARAQIYQM